MNEISDVSDITIEPGSLPAGCGRLAWVCCQKALPLQVLRSGAGYYIGTADDEGPCSRESMTYYKTEESASRALALGGWTQKVNP